MKRLRVGDEVLYTNPYHIEKTKVKSVDRKRKTATLSNGVDVHMKYDESSQEIEPVKASSNANIWIWGSIAEEMMFRYETSIATTKAIKHLQSLELHSLPKESTRKLRKSLEKILDI